MKGAQQLQEAIAENSYERVVSLLKESNYEEHKGNIKRLWESTLWAKNFRSLRGLVESEWLLKYSVEKFKRIPDIRREIEGSEGFLQMLRETDNFLFRYSENGLSESEERDLFALLYSLGELKWSNIKTAYTYTNSFTKKEVNEHAYYSQFMQYGFVMPGKRRGALKASSIKRFLDSLFVLEEDESKFEGINVGNAWRVFLESKKWSPLRSLFDSGVFDSSSSAEQNLSKAAATSERLYSVENRVVVKSSGGVSYGEVESIKALLLSITAFRERLKKERSIDCRRFEMELSVFSDNRYKAVFMAYGIRDVHLPPKVIDKLMLALRSAAPHENVKVEVCDEDLKSKGFPFDKVQVNALLKEYVDAFNADLDGCRRLFFECSAIHTLGIKSTANYICFELALEKHFARLSRRYEEAVPFSFEAL